MNSILKTSVYIFLVLMFSLILTLRASAQTDVILQSSYQSTTAINAGETNTFHAIAQNTTGSDKTVLLDLELYNSSNQKVAQQWYDNTSIAPYNIVDVTLVSPSNLPAGTYIWKVGIFNPNWNGLIAWYDHPLDFQINGGQTQTGDVYLSSNALGEFHLNNCPTITAILNNSSINQRPILIDFELRDANNNLVNQYFKDNFTVPSALTRSPTFIMNECDNKLSNGNYHYSIGIFNPSWSSLIHWYDNVQNFNVAI